MEKIEWKIPIKAESQGGEYNKNYDYYGGYNNSNYKNIYRAILGTSNINYYITNSVGENFDLKTNENDYDKEEYNTRRIRRNDIYPIHEYDFIQNCINDIIKGYCCLTYISGGTPGRAKNYRLSISPSSNCTSRTCTGR